MTKAQEAEERRPADVSAQAPPEGGQCPACGGDAQKARRRVRVPAWFRKWFWFWLFLMSLVALAGYCMMVHSGNWTPDHLMKLIPGGLL